MKENKGFSLIELIIVVAIMAILVAIIAPNLSKYLFKSKENTDDSNIDTVRKVYEQACALTNTELCEPEATAAGAAAMGCWTDIDEDTAFYDSDATDVNGYTAFSSYAAETLEGVPKSKVNGNVFQVKIVKSTTSSGSMYSVEVRIKP